MTTNNAFVGGRRAAAGSTDCQSSSMEAQGPSTTSTVSASGVEAIETTLEVKPQLQISNASIEQVFDIELTVDELLKGGWTRVSLSRSC